MPKPQVDYSLYLVTDSGLLPSGRTLVGQIVDAIRGGVTIVQLREKKLPTDQFIALAKEVHTVTKLHNIPLIVNDNLDVAAAVGSEGLHIGWEDVDYVTARTRLGEGKIIGVSVSDKEQARKASETGCDYIGVGPVWATATKPNHNPELLVPGFSSLVSHIRTSLGPWGATVPVVAIGGIKATNAHQLPNEKIQGLAVVSAIMTSPSPTVVSTSLLLTYALTSVLTSLRTSKPLVHHITNSVVKDFSANICLAVGASPIMSENIEEAEDLAGINGGLVVNMGTAGGEAVELFLKAMQENTRRGKPVVVDPVGAGATTLRRETTRKLIKSGDWTVVKGNEGEIRTVAGEGVQMKGVDSGLDASTPEAKTRLVLELARATGKIVVMTGVKDYVSDGERTWQLADGDEFQGMVTGTGCSLGTVIAAVLAVNKSLGALAVAAAITAYNAAARRAKNRESVRGPASWKMAFVDELWRAVHGADWEWVAEAVERVHVVGCVGAD